MLVQDVEATIPKPLPSIGMSWKSSDILDISIIIENQLCPKFTKIQNGRVEVSSKQSLKFPDNLKQKLLL